MTLTLTLTYDYLHLQFGKVLPSHLGETFRHFTMLFTAARCLLQCHGWLSWLRVSFLLHVKYTLSYRIVCPQSGEGLLYTSRIAEIIWPLWLTSYIYTVFVRYRQWNRSQYLTWPSTVTQDHRQTVMPSFIISPGETGEVGYTYFQTKSLKWLWRIKIVGDWMGHIAFSISGLY